jgi:hypothetical protein
VKPHLIRYLGVSLTPNVGANDELIGVRVVPAGRDGHRVFGRTLADGEQDSGEPVAFYPYLGEELYFALGSVQVFLRDLERGNDPGPERLRARLEYSLDLADLWEATGSRVLPLPVRRGATPRHRALALQRCACRSHGEG